MRSTVLSVAFVLTAALFAGESRADQAVGAPLLTWPGKAVAATPRLPPAAPTSAVVHGALPTSIYASPSPTVPAASAAVTPPPPAAAQPDPAAAARAANGAALPPHTYSVGRQYGQQPDPVPLPAQFFAQGAGADLAAPPPPLPPNPVPGSPSITNAATANTPANRARAIALDTQSPDGDPN